MDNRFKYTGILIIFNVIIVLFFTFTSSNAMAANRNLHSTVNKTLTQTQPILLAATAQQQFQSNLQKTGQGIGYTDATGNGNGEDILTKKVGSIIQLFLSFLGVIFLILMVYGGYTWMTARGNEQEATKAKSIITNAIIGVALVLAAYAITSLLTGFWAISMG